MFVDVGIMHEMILAALYILQHKAYDNDCEQHQCMPFDEWCEQQVVKHRQFAYWSSVMKLQTTILVFVRSLRECNISGYIQSPVELMLWFFVLDHFNYARWLSVHIRDMQELPITNPAVYVEFVKGKFTVNKTCNKFSNLPLDQVHEQLNAVVKGDGGMIGLTEDEMHSTGGLLLAQRLVAY